MLRGDVTREHIVRQAASLFNRKGYAGASVADIMGATGLQKGGIYRHFGTKEELAVEALGYALGRMRERFERAMAGRTNAVEKLRGILEVFAGVPENPPVPGGCPLMNAIIDSDDGNEALRARAIQAMDGLRRTIRETVEEGQQRGEIRASVDPKAVEAVVIATLEGGVMLARLYGDPELAQHTIGHLERYLEQELASDPSPPPSS